MIDKTEQRSPLRNIIVAVGLFLVAKNIILVQSGKISGFGDIFRQFSGYFTITLSISLGILTTYRIIKEIYPKRG